jgi:hypothetical protein
VTVSCHPAPTDRLPGLAVAVAAMRADRLDDRPHEDVAQLAFAAVTDQPELLGSGDVAADRLAVHPRQFRRRHLVPVPRVATLGELNELLAAGDVVDDARHIARRPDPVGVVAAAEVASMAALPEEAFDSAAILGAKVDTKGRVSVRQTSTRRPWDWLDER